jgi:hypothetical protein
MAEGRQITFISLKSFDKRLSKLVDDDACADLEEALAKRPTAGDLIPGSGGARKRPAQATARSARGYPRLQGRRQEPGARLHRDGAGDR